MRFFVPIVAVALMAIAYFTLLKNKSNSTDTSQNKTQVTAPSSEETKPLLGENMLAQHAAPEAHPSLDTRIVHQFIQTANRENRHIDTFYFSTNPDLTEILLGKKGMSHPQLKANHPIIGKNQYNETVMLDRWETPYHVHLIERNNIEIISAGPDKTMGTEDDLRWPPEEPN